MSRCKNTLSALLQGTLQQFVDDFFRSVLCSNSIVPPAVKYFFDFLDEQALKHDNVDEETLHIWKTNRCSCCSSFYQQYMMGRQNQEERSERSDPQADSS